MNKENIFYVYLHRRATDNKVFYVGKGKNKRAYDKTNRSSYWKSVVNKHDYSIEIVFDKLTEDEALQCEIDTILEMKYFGYPLVNHTNGGEGTSGMKQSAETIAKRVEKNTGKKRTDESKKRISDSLLGRKLSQEHCESIRKCQTGKKKSPEDVAKRAKSNTGKTRTANQKKYMSDVAKITARNHDLSSKMAGSNNPQADHTLHTFVHIESGEKFTGTRIDLCNKFNLNPSSLRNLFCNKRKIALGWALLKEENDNRT